MGAAERSYIVVFRWPDDGDQEARIDSLETLGVVRAIGRGLASRTPPVLVARCDAEQANVLAAKLRDSGVACGAITHAEIMAALHAPQALSLAPAVDAPAPMYLATFRRDPPCGFLASDLRLLVRGSVAVTRVERGPGAAAEAINAQMTSIAGPIHVEPRSAQVPRRVSRFELLDLHMRVGRRLRIDARRFDFRSALGNEFGQSDTENADRLAHRLAIDSPEAIVDLGFSGAKWIAPFALEFRQSAATGSGGRIAGELLPFAVYSAFRAVVDARLRGG